MKTNIDIILFILFLFLLLSKISVAILLIVCSFPLWAPYDNKATQICNLWHSPAKNKWKYDFCQVTLHEGLSVFSFVLFNIPFIFSTNEFSYLLVPLNNGHWWMYISRQGNNVIRRITYDFYLFTNYIFMQIFF